MSTSFEQKLNENLRLIVLQLLAQADGYDLNIHILRSGLADFGHKPSMDKLSSELHWLDEQSLLVVRTVGQTAIAKLTDRGKDVAEGHARVPGVARPGPGETCP